MYDCNLRSDTSWMNWLSLDYSHVFTQLLVSRVRSCGLTLERTLILAQAHMAQCQKFLSNELALFDAEIQVKNAKADQIRL